MWCYLCVPICSLHTKFMSCKQQMIKQLLCRSSRHVCWLERGPTYVPDQTPVCVRRLSFPLRDTAGMGTVGGNGNRSACNYRASRFRCFPFHPPLQCWECMVPSSGPTHAFSQHCRGGRRGGGCNRTTISISIYSHQPSFSF